MFWRQKSRNLWLKDGDRNTKFCHCSPMVRRARNSIISLETDEGVELTCVAGIKDYLFTWLKSKWGSGSDATELFDLSVIPPCIAEDANSNLCAPFTAEEVCVVIKELLGDKALGPDGFSVMFYKRFWSDI